VRIVVQKFGGSSVADPAKMRRCAQRAAEAHRAGAGVVVVVSAMGDTTDDLLALAGRVCREAGVPPAKRELDQLMATGEQVSIALMAMTLGTMGLEAVSLTGSQCGIRTEAAHTRARITDIDAGRLRRELAAGRVPVVAGFQGVTEEGEVTTLGRGGSDTTAVAVAAALGAEVCEVYTDVDGVYTADPRIVPGARLHERVSYDEMMEAASQGAKVMHLRAVELGKKAGVPIRVLHSQRPGTGTLICGERDAMLESRLISTVALKTEIGRVTIVGLPNRPGVQREVFGPIAAAGLSVDDIIQNEVHASPGAVPGDRCTIAFTVERQDLDEVCEVVRGSLARVASRGPAPEVQVDTALVKVSAVGVGMQSQAGVAATMFRALAEAGVRIQNITTSEIKISCLIPEECGARAVRVVHEAFGLGQDSAGARGAGAA